MTDIPDIPELPKEIKDAIEKDKLVIFIGAGVSTLVGCKRWIDLGNELIGECEKLDLISYRELQGIKSRADGKRLISIAYELMKTNYLSKFYEIFDKSLECNSNKCETQDTYDLLYKFSKTCVTTNADTLFDKKYNKANVITDFEHNRVQIETQKLYKIHGTQEKRDSLVFVAESYIRRYNNRHFKDFLRDLFNDYIVLFIGYGLSEFELLDYIMLKPNVNVGNKEAKHFALMPYFSYEQSISQIDNLYYNELNIQIIPYAIDRKGYDQLYNVIKSWNGQINNTTQYIKNNIDNIDNFLSKKLLDSNEINSILELIKKDSIYFDHFNKICFSHKELTNLFIEPLYNNDFFSPKNNPTPEKSKYVENAFSIPRWNALDFLDTYCSYLDISTDYSKIDIFIRIINENTNLNNYTVDNDKTDSSFVTYILKLPAEKITESHIDFISKALNSKWGALLTSDAIEKCNFDKILALPKELELKFLSIIFDVKVIDYKVISLLDYYYCKEIIRKNILSLYNRLQLGLVDIIILIIKKIPFINFTFIQYNSNKDTIPYLDDYDYTQTLINLLIWILQKQDKPIDTINTLKKQFDEAHSKILELIEQKVISNASCAEFCEDVTCNHFYDIPSPYNLSQLENLSSDELVKILNTDETNSVPLTGLESDIYSLFQKRPDKYIQDLENFLNIDFKYLYQIFNAYTSLLHQQKFQNTKPILAFIHNLINRNDIWINKTNEKGFNYQIWLVEAIGNYLIEYLNQEIDKNISENFNLIKSISLKIYENISPECDDNPYTDYMTTMLNSETGIISQLLVRLYLYGYHFFNVEDSEIKASINDLMQKNIIMIFAALGFWHENIFAKNDKFALEILESVASSNDNIFKSFSTCYFNNTKSAITQQSYEIIRNSKFIERVLLQILNNPISGFASLVCRNYLREYEALDDNQSLISRLILTKNVNCISELITFIINSREYLNETHIKLCIQLWGKICQVLQNEKNNTSYRELIIQLLDLIIILNEVDETTKHLIAFSIIEIPPYRIEHVLLPKFVKLYGNERNRKNIHEILKEFCDKGVYFENYNSNITELIRMISKNDNDFAIELCNRYIQNKNRNYEDILREISNKTETSN